MIYLKIMGNCGNQFFQYAFARALQERYGGELIIDYSLIHADKEAWEGSDNLLSYFNVVPYTYTLDNKMNPHSFLAKMIEKCEKWLKLKSYTKKRYRYYLFCARHFERFGVYYFTSSYFSFKYNSCPNVYINGYFESSKYFKDIDEKICRELSPRNEVLDTNRELYDAILSSESVCISIKRRDLDREVTKAVYNYDISYFYNAVKYIEEKVTNPVWVIFSDNIEWCKENFKVNGTVYYETENNPIWEKIRLMSACKHFIIHNSTFSWWAQHLSQNKDKIVVVPVKWLQRDDQPIDIYEDYFKYMDNDGHIHPNHK